jgi:integrase
VLSPHLRLSTSPSPRNTAITLSGEANKSKRNRVIGLPPYVSEAMLYFRQNNDLGSSRGYVFENGDKPYNKDFFKLLWRKFRLSNTLEPGCTLYSFRHSGAIAVYEKTGSIVKLQTALGHSDLRVSLTYLRGIKVRTLQIHDMPDLG